MAAGTSSGDISAIDYLRNILGFVRDGIDTITAVQLKPRSVAFIQGRVTLDVARNGVVMAHDEAYCSHIECGSADLYIPTSEFRDQIRNLQGHNYEKLAADIKQLAARRLEHGQNKCYLFPNMSIEEITDIDQLVPVKVLGVPTCVLGGDTVDLRLRARHLISATSAGEWRNMRLLTGGQRKCRAA